MAGVISVQRHTVALASADLTTSTALTGTAASNTANCIPFLTCRVTDPADPNENGNLGNYQVNARFVGSDIEIHRDRATVTAAIEVEVAVVEFDSGRVDVEQDVYQLTSGGSFDFTDTATIATVDRAAAFLTTFGFQNSGPDGSFRSHMITGTIPSNATVVHTRNLAAGTNDGNFYVAESKSGDFSVQALSIVVTTASNTGTLGSTVNMDKTFLIGSLRCDTTTDANQDNTFIAELTDADTVTVTRNGTNGTVTWNGFAVTITTGNVQRGTIVAQGATASQDVTITAVDLDFAMAVHAGNNGNVVGGSFPGAVTTLPNEEKADALVTLELVDSTTLRVKHGVSGSEADNDISWEVVEWETGGAGPAPRRVMVR